MIRDLLFTDLDGARLADPETVIEAAADEPRYLERVPGLRSVLVDDAAGRYHRYLALLALTSWGHAPVYPVVAATVEQGRNSPWHGMLTDNEGRDRTFPALAGAVADGARFVAEAGEPDRRRVLRAMLGRADEVYFGWQLGHAVDAPEWTRDLVEAIERGLARPADAWALPAARKPVCTVVSPPSTIPVALRRMKTFRAPAVPRFGDHGFDLALQLADLCAVLAKHDRARAVDLAERLLRRDSRTVVRTHLCSVVPFRA
ncbi:hypothetical protein [Saccharothrix sp.]|uniref:hypothetical protein n=1 Tax=Saccharothrix sp. TaxID=1873460 RepID=UPI002812713D|nr:hypothetical protein [Saccharothrix sp.]